MTDTPRADALVLFGITGDLAAKRLLPALYHLALHDRLPAVVVGVASRAWDDARLRDHAREVVHAAHGDEPVDEGALSRMLDALRYVSGDYQEAGTYDAVRRALGEGHACVVCYLSIPPALFDDVIEGLVSVGLHDGGRIVLEKPFGRDLASARELNELVLRHYPEPSVFRIDHFLGKESVQNLMVFRFANTILDPIWNRYYVDHVEITLAEDFGVEGRGRFYDAVGALRDVVQNHLIGVMALLAMEPPATDDPEALRDEIAKVTRAIRPFDPADVVRGQFEGYRDDPDVAEDSETETYVAVRTWIDSWRWSGVPWVIRTGKSMGATVTEAVVELVRPPRPMFTDQSCRPEPNRLRFRLKPEGEIVLSMEAKRPGDELVSMPVEMRLAEPPGADGDRLDAYERLLDDALDGDVSLFARQDAVEAAWAAVAPVLADPPPLHSYESGSWGPSEANRLLVKGEWSPCRI